MKRILKNAWRSFRYGSQLSGKRWRDSKANFYWKKKLQATK